ncbi:MAG: DUF3489 domain-containing protein [Devosia sp.]
MVKLTDTHRIILTTAGGRERPLVLPLPKSLKLTWAKAEPTLVRLMKAGMVAEVAATDGEPLWRTDEALGKLTLVATPAGLKAVGIEPAAARSAGVAAIKPKTKSRTAAARTVPGKRPSESAGAPAAPGASTKLGIVVAALKGKKGATLADLTTATGWQPHSVRGAISGALKKKLGLAITSSLIDGRGRVYRIAE